MKTKTVIIVSLVTFLIVVAALIGSKYYEEVIVPKQKYEQAVSYLDNKEFDEASAAFEELGDYSDSKEMITETKYRKAIYLQENGDFDSAIEIYEALGPYKDSPKNLADATYGKAMMLYESGNYVDSKFIFQLLDGYRDSDQYIKKATLDPIKNANVGDTVYLGSYEQDYSSYYPEYIEWKVLDKDENKALLISAYILDQVVYNGTRNYDITWETSYLRKWLNEDFFDIAFDDMEKGIIETTTVTPDKGPKYNSDQGNATYDKVFCLSYVETEKYLATLEARKCKATAYAWSQGVDVWNSSQRWASWWLRTVGHSDPNTFTNILYVGDKGTFADWGMSPDWSICGVRPVIWVNYQEMED